SPHVYAITGTADAVPPRPTFARPFELERSGASRLKPHRLSLHRERPHRAVVGDVEIEQRFGDLMCFAHHAFQDVEDHARRGTASIDRGRGADRARATEKKK